ncbi:BrnA antitoxin family protein [Methylobacterium sp. J-077]|uniref:BrnA antitoxin family protein n=1 Tax=Methylobacterium sp. J-077 TaxID=2836656 RepID=UPI001FBC059C|nr:BrnA antitoxin family protein [Methylobacterium sp. J-077]MCJ2121661.1 BrnA antitoxin family protein [Methylobacterium sp. J-077]
MTTRDTTRRRAPPLSDAEEALLQASIVNNPDSAELTDAELAHLRPARDVLPPAVYAALTRRSPSQDETGGRVQLTLNVDPDVLAAYQAGGPGWQARMNEALAEGLARGKRRPKAAKSAADTSQPPD